MILDYFMGPPKNDTEEALRKIYGLYAVDKWADRGLDYLTSDNRLDAATKKMQLLAAAKEAGIPRDEALSEAGLAPDGMSASQALLAARRGAEEAPRASSVFETLFSRKVPSILPEVGSFRSPLDLLDDALAPSQATSRLPARAARVTMRAVLAR